MPLPIRKPSRSHSGEIHPRSNKWYGWLPDLPDHRDLPYSTVRPKGGPLPRAVDLRAGCSPVENQKTLGSCTANALVGALEFLENKAKSMAFVDLSRLFVYFNERVIAGTVASDSGAFLRDGIKSLAKLGVCKETMWPYLISDFQKKPSLACYKEAKQHAITSYHRLDTVDEMRSCLAEGFPFVFGFSVYEAFESAEVEKSGILNMPKPDERNVGGHAVMAAGYNDKAKRFLVRNSWDASWGQAGYFTIPYAYLRDRNLSDDFWTIRA